MSKITLRRPLIALINKLPLCHNHTKLLNIPAFSKHFGISSKLCYSSISQPFAKTPTSLITEVAPDFTSPAVFPNDSMEPLTLSTYRGQYVLLLFYPLNFTFVCPSEILSFDKFYEEFKTRNTQVIGISVDSQFSHLAWRNTPLHRGGISKIKFPLVSDLSKSISKSYGVLTKDNTLSLRGLFLIDKEGIIRHCVQNDLPLGRNVEEALRMVDALQHVESSGDVCPANWTKGKKSMKPSMEGAADYLSTL
ncbi:peroxiredoxin-2-like [Hylaeus volcanicus]|uniref:peroxiredoxin-2-like n=1 Tax=Hylaeus volcanicus TaxID=313075 RepID=UPI0023B78010|nr:peroxiredoxin-2-like [Hylaeus volcanicus]